jgi:predicted permease
MLYLTVTRLVLLPAACLWGLHLLPLATDVYQLAVIVAIMPVSVSSTILTRRYGGCPDFAARAAVITTLAGAVTVPLTMWLLF